MANTYYPLLPKLRESSAVNPDRSSIWENEGYDFLNHLVKSLAVGGDIKDVQHIDSIPDIWARPLLFQMALFDKQNDAATEFVKGLHDRVVGEWRSILAMLALNDVRHLGLTASIVSLNDDTSPLGQVLKSLAPQETISSENDWLTTYVIKYQGTPIAMTSPTTLVAAAADYSRELFGVLSVPWSADGERLTDPITMLTGDELSSLHLWLTNLYGELQQTVRGSDSEAGQSLLAALDEYIRDVKLKGTTNVTNFKYTDMGLGLNIGLYRHLNHAIKGKAASADDSAVKLMLNGSGRTPQKETLIVSPDMVREFSQQEGVPLAQLVVWPGVSGADITEDMLSGDRTRLGNAILVGAEYYRPEDFFTERMTFMEPGGVAIASLPYQGDKLLAGDDLTAVLPLKRELLELFSADEIARRVRIEDNGDNYTVTFSFPLTGANGAGTDYRFAKKYRKDKQIFLSTIPPVVEIWPNFRRAGWSRYYLYYANTESQKAGATELGKNFIYVAPWRYGVDIAPDMPAGGMANTYTAKMDGFPEALVCTVTTTENDSTYATAVEAGLLLLTPPEEVIAEPEMRWQVGIDFGTSSTMLYCRNGSETPRPLAFGSHLYQVMDPGPVARSGVAKGFLPVDTTPQQDGSLLSVFHLLNANKLNEELLPIQDGHVLWVDSERYDEYNALRTRIDANLKWKDDAPGRRKVNAYIKQICLQSLAEAAAHNVSSVDWNFSFPTAFSREQLSSFEVSCADAVEDAYADSGFSPADSERIEKWPESKASAYHFNKLNSTDTNFSDGAICVDIGAGTTDISVISGQPGRIVYHTSIKFAGRYLFRPIYRHYELFAKDATSILAQIQDSDEEFRNMKIDLDMREHSEEYLRNLKNITGKAEVKDMLQGAQFALAGVFYYLGLLLKTLHERGIYAESHVPDIFLGGNGSRILYWIAGSSFSDSNPFLEVLKDAIVAGSGLDKGYRFKLHLSANPKIEVASGMIGDRPYNDSAFYDEEEQSRALFGAECDEYQQSAVLAGSGYSLADGSHAAGDFISARDINAGIRIDNITELTDFIDSFNRNRHIWFDGITFDDDDLADIQKRINSYYVAEKGKDTKLIFPESVFIQGLKKAVEVIANG